MKGIKQSKRSAESLVSPKKAAAAPSSPKKAVVSPAASRNDPATTPGTQATPTTPHRSGRGVSTVTPSRPAKSRSPSPHTPSRAAVNEQKDTPQKAAAIEVGPRVNLIYKIIRKSTGALGGNGHTGAIYGELTMGSMQRIVNYMVQNCELDRSSIFIDVGSGLGKPNFHVAQDPAVRISIGAELETLRHQLSMKNLFDVMKRVSADPEAPETDADDEDEDAIQLFSGTNFINLDIDNAETLNPFTHIYQYDLGFPPDLQSSIAKKFNNSMYAKYFISYRPPHRVIEEYGYDVEYMHHFLTSMHGSGEGHTVYFYKRACPLGKGTSGCRKMKLPKKGALAAEDIYCDEAFYEAIKLAAGPVQVLSDHAAAAVEQHLTAERPKRERKPRTFF